MAHKADMHVLHTNARRRLVLLAGISLAASAAACSKGGNAAGGGWQNTQPGAQAGGQASGVNGPGGGGSASGAGPSGTKPPTSGGSGAGSIAGSGGGGAINNAGGGSAGSAGAGPTTGPGSGGSAGSSGNTGGPAAPRVDNPYAGAKGYVNPEWQAKAMAEQGGDRIANTPTAVWLDRIAAIQGTANSQSNGPMGLADHLNAALTQQADYIQLVIYDLPGRDCSALASNGELGVSDLPRYKSEYIDPIVAIMGDAKYRSLRIIDIIEPDSLPNLVTNTNVDKCAQMKQNNGYVDGVAYALTQLGSLPNAYNYLDAGHHGWLGWDSNLGPSADLFAQVAKQAGIQYVQGFITNTANYSALKEPYFDSNTMVGGTSVKQAKWVDYNPYVDETSYALALRDKLIGAGFASSIGLLIDTSRNGWGGPSRPTAASTATTVDAFVDGSRIDRRIHAGNWCNQSGAGIGERPRAAPAANFHAYVWIKPPGESDGASMMIQNSEGKGFDQMCDPTYGGNARNGNNMTGALANAPLAGAWFSAQFQQLMTNAYPAL